ncbi:uncharacterized protein CDV56_109693 [Aspergillus thermomutatus]|uniref:Uncharacterized protein n=1 Tax=Aspergillus thermomutatus TaxID=41047 RepID=A0A397HZ54_ASPTH|nr:uncharacterized protein CDV56_109693 [Aspergillus thermomutatus]RHZ68579.1 hypothetical protein CDV56_109693 [Aspergillus thermomutatus]
MVPAPSPDPHSVVETLRQTALKNSSAPPPQLSLPSRSRTVSNETQSYSEAAIELTGARNDINQLDQRVERFEQGARAALTSLSSRLGAVEEDLEELKSQFNDFRKEVRTEFDGFRAEFDGFRSGLANNTAIQINGLRKWLDDPLQPVSAPVQVGDSQAFKVASEFPRSVKEFWQLGLDKSALTRLARHYGVTGWERWQRSTSEDTDVTEYDELEDAVAAHSERCLRILAATWGLHYSELERPRPKRKAEVESDTEARRVRPKNELEDEALESVISQDERGNIFCQELVRQVRPRQRLTSEIPFREVLERYPLPPGHHRMSFETASIRWRLSSSSKKSRGTARSNPS